jgi:zinc protease
MRFVLGFLIAGFASFCQAATDIQVVTSPNGHKAWLVEERGIPFVALELLFDGGASIEPAEQRGGVNLMMALLEEGCAGFHQSKGKPSRLFFLSNLSRFSFDFGAVSN